MKPFAPAGLLFAALLFLYCSESTLVGKGGSSETVNAQLIISDTTASVIIDKNEAADLSMRIYSVDYRPFEKRGFTDSISSASKNEFSWKAPASGNYNILLTTATKQLACFVRNLALKQGATDTIACMLEPKHPLSGTIVGIDSARVTAPYIVAIHGSPFFGCSDSTGRFTMGAVPPCDYAINVRSTAKRLFVASASYSITTDMVNQSTRLRIIAP